MKEKLELGDGEPSPPKSVLVCDFKYCPFCGNYAGVCCGECEGAKSYGRSGAAQEVSPPSPEPVCPMCCKPVFTDRAEGDTRELKAALKVAKELLDDSRECTSLSKADTFLYWRKKEDWERLAERLLG